MPADILRYVSMYVGLVQDAKPNGLGGTVDYMPYYSLLGHVAYLK